MQGNILVSDDGRACLADIGLTRVAGDLNSASAISHTSTTNGASTVRWCPPELLDPERFGSKRGSGPTKKSDIYSMAMTIYEVSFLRYRLGRSIDVVSGSNGQASVLRVHRSCGNASYHSRNATEETDFRHHPGLHPGIVGSDGILLGCGSFKETCSRPGPGRAEMWWGTVETQAWGAFDPTSP